MRRAVALGLVAAATLTLPAGIAAPAGANTSHDVGLTGFRDLAVDETHGHVFLSDGASSVVVTDLSGKRLGVLTGLPGAAGMTMDDAHARLFVALSGSGSVAVVDAADPLGAGAVTTYPVQPNSCPTDVAYTSGLVWVGATCDHSTGDLYSLDPSDGSSHKQNGLTLGDPVLFAAPQVPDTLFVGQEGGTPQPLSELTTTAGQNPSVTPAHSRSDVRSSALAVDASGKHLVTGGRQVLRISDLTRTATYRTPTSTDAVAQRASDGMVAFGGTDGPIVFKPGAAHPYRVYHLGSSPTVEPHGLAFGRKNLYAVTSSSGTVYRLRVITPRKLARVRITTDHRHFAFGRKAGVSVTVNRADHRARVMLLATHLDGRQHRVARGRFDRRGHFHARVRVTERTRLTAVVHDTARFDGRSKSRRVTVAAGLRTRFLHAAGHSGQYTLFHPSQRARLLGKVLPDHSADCVTFHVQFHAQGHWGYDGYTDCVSLRFHSEAIGYVQGDSRLVGIPMRLRAEWAGDVRNTRKTSAWRYAKFVRGGGRPDVAVPRGTGPVAARIG